MDTFRYNSILFLAGLLSALTPPAFAQTPAGNPIFIQPINPAFFGDADPDDQDHTTQDRRCVENGGPQDAYPNRDNAPVANPGILFVDRTAPTGGNGRCWAHAIRELRDAITIARDSGGAVSQIWVARGTYTPTHDPANRFASFELVSGVAIYGGFAGWESHLTQRNPNAHVTVLSGDVRGNDSNQAQTLIDNVYHVVDASGVDPTAILDGFTIKAGVANGASAMLADVGGGAISINGAATITNCIFTGNRAATGGAVFIHDGFPTISACSFESNTALRGAGLAVAGVSDVEIRFCRFLGNEADDAGGAVYFSASGAATIGVTRFHGNHAAIGGAIAITPGASVAVLSTLIAGNTANIGAGVAVQGDSDAIFAGCTFYANSAASFGGGLYASSDAISLVRNAIFWANTDATGNVSEAQIFTAGASIDVAFSCIQGGFFGLPGIITTNPLFRNPLGADGIAGTPDDDLRLNFASGCIDAGDNTILGVLSNRTNTSILFLDLDGLPRFIDHPAILDTGVGPAPITDMGAYELAASVLPVPVDPPDIDDDE